MTGLAGTGSKDLVVPGAFVPEHRTHSIVDVHHGRDPGFAVNDRPYFRLPWRLVFAYTIAAPAIGAALARSMPSSTTTACAFRPMAGRRSRWTPL